MPTLPAASASPDPVAPPQEERVMPPHARERLERRARRLEVRRLRQHFERVLGTLRGRDVSHLAPAQRAAREGHLAELERYARRGRFPKNGDFPDRLMPYFVDAEGTRCAMAHLIEVTGAAAFVERVVATANNAFVPELAGDPELQAWLEREGLTAEEAAMIQPSYCFTPAQECLCNGYVGVVEATVEAIGADVSYRVDAVHGSTTLVVGDLVQAFAPSYPIAVGDAILLGVLSGNSVVPRYPVDPDGMVDTTSCVSISGAVPPAAPKQGAIDSLLVSSGGACGVTLPAEWNVLPAECGGTTVTTSSSSTGGAGGRGPGDGDPGSCSTPGAGLDGTSGGALLLGALLVASAARARARRPPRARAARR